MTDLDALKREQQEELQANRPLMIAVAVIGMAFGLYVIVGLLETGVNLIATALGAVVVMVLNAVVLSKTKRLRTLTRQIRELERK